MYERWSDLPLDRAIHLRGASTQAFELATEPLPADAPAILTYYPRPTQTKLSAVEALLERLEADTIELFPTWLPGSEGIEDSSGSSIAAIRAIAIRFASKTAHFGPFLADLAEQALTSGMGRATAYPPEVRAPALARVVAASYGCERAAVLIDIPPGMTAVEQHALGSACEWLVDKGRFGIWLCGPLLEASDRIESVRLSLPSAIAEIVGPSGPNVPREPERGQLFYPPIVGLPHHNSPAEKRLEAALRGLAWSQGRRWNQPYPHRPGFVIDLIWAEERCAVEIDGPDHRGALKFAKDRRRDVLLQLDGYAVLRFTNDRISSDLDQVLAELQQFLEQQRCTVRQAAY